MRRLAADGSINTSAPVATFDSRGIHVDGPDGRSRSPAIPSTGVAVGPRVQAMLGSFSASTLASQRGRSSRASLRRGTRLDDLLGGLLLSESDKGRRNASALATAVGTDAGDGRSVRVKRPGAASEHEIVIDTSLGAVLTDHVVTRSGFVADTQHEYARVGSGLLLRRRTLTRTVFPGGSSHVRTHEIVFDNLTMSRQGGYAHFIPLHPSRVDLAPVRYHRALRSRPVAADRATDRHLAAAWDQQ